MPILYNNFIINVRGRVRVQSDNLERIRINEAKVSRPDGVELRSEEDARRLAQN